MLSVIEISKWYGTQRGVEGVSFDVAPGSIVGLLGPNGAGKTTLLGVLTLECAATAGEVRLDGRVVAADPIGYRNLYGYVPAESYLYDHLTGREFLEFVAEIRGLAAGRAARCIDGHLERFEVTGDADRLIGGYSSGMRRKIAIAAALLHAPRVLYLDEPTNALDAVSVRRLREHLLELKQAGVAILLTTHVLEVVEKLADRIVILRAGRKIAEGALDALRRASHDAELENLFLAVTGA